MIHTKSTKTDKEKADAARENGKLGGRPKYQIDYKALGSLCAIQCTGEEIAGVLDVDYDTLNKRLAEEGHGGFTDYNKKKSSGGKMSLRRKQFEIAKEGNPTMLIWLGKQYLEQSEKTKTDLTSGGEKIANNFIIQPVTTKSDD